MESQSQFPSKHRRYQTECRERVNADRLYLPYPSVLSANSASSSVSLRSLRRCRPPGVRETPEHQLQFYRPPTLGMTGVEVDFFYRCCDRGITLFIKSIDYRLAHLLLETNFVERLGEFVAEDCRRSCRQLSGQLRAVVVTVLTRWAIEDVMSVATTTQHRATRAHEGSRRCTALIYVSESRASFERRVSSMRESP